MVNENYIYDEEVETILNELGYTKDQLDNDPELRERFFRAKKNADKVLFQSWVDMMEERFNINLLRESNVWDALGGIITVFGEYMTYDQFNKYFNFSPDTISKSIIIDGERKFRKYSYIELAMMQKSFKPKYNMQNGKDYTNDYKFNRKGEYLIHIKDVIRLMFLDKTEGQIDDIVKGLQRETVNNLVLNELRERIGEDEFKQYTNDLDEN